jgi:SAM-dependent methyltransferase
MSGDAAKIYSDRQYLDNNPDWHLEDTKWKAGEIDAILRRNGVSWHSGVEVGCGSGGIVAELARRYPQNSLTGYDVAKDADAFWSRHTEKNANYKHADFLAGNDRKDLLMLIDVFEHVDDYMGFLRQLSGRADTFVFHIPLDLHVQGLLRRSYMRARKVVGHLHYFTRESALATLTDTGYEIVDWSYTDVSGQANKSTRAMRTRLINPVRRLLSSAAPNLAALLLGGFSLVVLCRRQEGQAANS